MDDLKKNEIYEAAMTGFTSEGAGVCRIKGRAVFVSRALPGETWRVRIVKVTKTAVYGRGEERLTTSPERVEPDCPNFGRCGGCNLMHMSYAAELQMKLDRVNDALRRIGGTEVRAERILGSERVEGYRNKAIYAVGEGENGPVAGFYRTGSHDIIPAPNCLLQSDEASKCAGAVVDWMRTNGVSVWNGRSGTVRHVYTRRARDGAALCCVVTGRRLSPSLTRSLTDALRGACPALTGVVECVNRTEGNTVLSGEFRTLWGYGTLRDRLCGFEFELAPQAFYQINPPQAERLYAQALEYALPERGGTVLDLYCGAGTISLCLSQRAGRVIGAEIVPEAVENARANAERNGVTNAEFICADAGEAARELKSRGITPDAIVVDPPRKGMDAPALEAIAYQTKDVLDAMIQDTGAAITSLRADGGASANNFLMQTQADLLRLPVDRPAQVETTAFGAAALAGLAAGVWGSLEEVAALRRSQHVFLPQRPQAACEAQYRLWRRAVDRALRWIENDV